MLVVVWHVLFVERCAMCIVGWCVWLVCIVCCLFFVCCLLIVVVMCSVLWCVVGCKLFGV